MDRSPRVCDRSSLNAICLLSVLANIWYVAISILLLSTANIAEVLDGFSMHLIPLQDGQQGYLHE